MQTIARLIVGTLVTCAALVVSPAAWAQPAYPSGPVRFVVPYAAGGGPDTVARLVGQKLGEMWKQPVVVDNKAGADGIVGTSEVVRAKPDGQTLLVNIALLVQSHLLRTNLPYDAFKDLAPVIPMAFDPLYLVVSHNLHAPDLKAFLQAAKAKPGQIAFGSFGNGSTAHLMLIGIKQAAGVDIIHVPYKGSAPVAQALMTGEVQVGLLPYTTARTVLASGKASAIAVTGTARTSTLPDVPTLQEAGLPGFDRRGWIALFAPAGTPKPIVDKINASVNEVLAMPDVAAKLAEIGSIVGGGTPQQFSDRLRGDLDYYQKLITAGNVKLDQ